jgi:hypothetical protein
MRGQELNTIGPTYQVVFLLSSTCVTQETTEHGGGTCFSNLPGRKEWSIQRVPYTSWSTPSLQFFQLGIAAPEISTRAITALLIVTKLTSTLIPLLPSLARCISTNMVWIDKGARRHENFDVANHFRLHRLRMCPYGSCPNQSSGL